MKLNAAQNPRAGKRQAVKDAYDNWPFAMNINPKRIYASMDGALTTLIRKAEKGDQKTKAMYGRENERHYDAIIEAMSQETGYWSPLRLGERTIFCKVFVIEVVLSGGGKYIFF